ncbi:MAG: formylglycine-generating enzyme family protein [Lentisphaeria bacterium]|nr:formylglycine-generating enzyme family protein [Lentisphaeria bacterium]
MVALATLATLAWTVNAQVTDPTVGNILGMQFVEVPAGSFRMGSNDGEPDEKPVHEVRISHPFWMGKHEVTQAEYEKLAGKNPSRFKGTRNPVEMVSWNDAVAFCEKLTERERSSGRLLAGYAYRLPTEAEWEYAARGGAKSRGTKYSGSDNVDKVVWHISNSGGKTYPVGQKKGNELGIFDMSGNVFEWCLDWHDAGYYGKSPRVDPANTVSASSCVIRGGCWMTSARNCRVADRYWNGPGFTSDCIGFRVCLAPVRR